MNKSDIECEFMDQINGFEPKRLEYKLEEMVLQLTLFDEEYFDRQRTLQQLKVKFHEGLAKLVKLPNASSQSFPGELSRSMNNFQVWTLNWNGPLSVLPLGELPWFDRASYNAGPALCLGLLSGFFSTASVRFKRKAPRKLGAFCFHTHQKELI